MIVADVMVVVVPIGLVGLVVRVALFIVFQRIAAHNSKRQTRRR